MNTLKTTVVRVLIPLVAVALIVIGATLVHAEAGEDKPTVKGAWQPADEDRAAFRDITDYNIFNADRRRIAERVDRERNPPEPKNTEKTDPVPVEEDPADPDTLYRLAGISHDAEGPIAYIEHTGTGELTRVQGPSEFSLGKITAIGYEKLVYVVDDDHRSVSIGQNLTGQTATPATTTAGGSTSTGGADTPKPGSREAILKAMRERRERELGNRNPAPQPEQTEQQPDEQTESSSGQSAPAGTRSAPSGANNQ
jgi:hypothetical protein